MVLPRWRGALVVGLTWLTGVTWLFSGSEECLATNISPAVITADSLSPPGRNIIHWLGREGRDGWAGQAGAAAGAAVTDNKLTEVFRPSVTCLTWPGLCGQNTTAGNYLHILATVKSSLWSQPGPPHWLRLATAYRALFLHVLKPLNSQPPNRLGWAGLGWL